MVLTLCWNRNKYNYSWKEKKRRVNLGWVVDERNTQIIRGDKQMLTQKNIFLFKVILLITLFASISYANTPKATIFGPEVIVRGTGQPVVEEMVFEVPYAGSAEIQIANGAEDDNTTSERVSSSVISLNDSDVIGPELFNQNVDGLHIPIELLAGINILKVELRSKPGGSISIQILAEVDSIELEPIPEPVEIGGDPLICNAIVTALGIPAFGIDVIFEVAGFEGILPVTSQTDLSGVAHATFGGFTETGAGVVSAAVVGSEPLLVDSEEFEVIHTQIGPQGGTIEGPNNVSVTFPPGAVDEYIPVSIEPLNENQIGKDTPPGYVFLGAVFLDIGDVLKDNADVSVPCPDGVPGDAEIYVVQVVEYAGVTMFLLVDTAGVQGDFITSEDPGFPGIIGSGAYCFFWAENIGWVGGQVTRKFSGSVVPGAVVTLSGGYFLDIADSSGHYILPAWAGNFVVVAFDEATGDHGEKQGYMPSNGASVVCNVQIGISSGPVQSTLTNGDFETGDLTGWVLGGAGSVITQLGPINPYEGNYMGMISTGSGAIGGASSSLEQSFNVPSGVTTLTLHYNFVSEEYWEWVGSQYNDVFNATLHTPEGSREVAFASVNTATWYGVSGIDFPGGDSTCGQTGWLEASIDVSQYAGTDDTLTLTVHDVGDTIYDSVVLLDTIKFDEQVLEIDEPPAPGIVNVGETVKYKFETNFSAKYTIETHIGWLSPTNTIITLYDDSMQQLESDDNSGSGYASRIDRELDTGTYYITVECVGNSSGEYSIEVRPYAVQVVDLVLAFEGDEAAGTMTAAKQFTNRLYYATVNQVRMKNLTVWEHTPRVVAILAAHIWVPQNPLLDTRSATFGFFGLISWIELDPGATGSGGSRTLLHEFGHLNVGGVGFGFGDEYCWREYPLLVNIPGHGWEGPPIKVEHATWYVQYFWFDDDLTWHSEYFYPGDAGYNNPQPAETCDCVMNNQDTFCSSSRGTHTSGFNDHDRQYHKGCWEVIKDRIAQIEIPAFENLDKGPCKDMDSSQGVSQYVEVN